MLKFHALTVAAIAPDAEDAVAIAFDVPAALRGEYRGSPGQHVVVRAQVGGRDIRRTYSLVSVPGEWPLRIVPRVHPQGLLSRHLAQRLRVGDRLEVLPPNGSFTPRRAPAGPATYVAFAAGCGITPVLAVMRALLARPGSQVMLFYGNSHTSRIMCLEELLSLKDRYLERLSLHFIMSREPQEVALYNGRIDRARVRELAAALFRPETVAEYFLCGPGDMIEQVDSTLKSLGVEPGRVHAEHFTVATTEIGAGAPHAAGAAVALPAPAAAAGADGVQVTVRMDGRQRAFVMSMGGETVLDGAARAGIELPFSCRAGVCSTCRTKVVRGAVEMAQNYALEDWELEQGYVLACQSRVTTPTLELDYDEK